MKTWINGEVVDIETELEHVIEEKIREETVERQVEFINEETGEIETKTYEEVIEVPYTLARLVDTGVPIVIVPESCVETLEDLQAQLEGSDYKITKASEYFIRGLPLPYDMEALYAERQDLRDRINKLKEAENE